MLSFLPGIPGADDIRDLARKVDTARHHGVPAGVVLELDLQSAPPETAGFDPLSFVTGSGRPMLLRDAVAAIHRAADDDRVAGLIARVQITAAPAAAVQELRQKYRQEFTAGLAERLDNPGHRRARLAITGFLGHLGELGPSGLIEVIRWLRRRHDRLRFGLVQTVRTGGALDQLQMRRQRLAAGHVGSPALARSSRQRQNSNETISLFG